MIRLVLPIPDAILSPNARPHWAQRSRMVRHHRNLAYMVALKAVRELRMKPPQWDRARTRVVFFWPDKRRRDKDNAAARLKAYWDGIADAGVVSDDVGLTHEPVQMMVDRKNPRVEVTITPTEEQP